MGKVSFRDEILRVREEAILGVVNRLLADKGYDLMTMDEVAASVGIAKTSLYKHFVSKEELAAAAMIRLLDRALVVIEGLRAGTRGPLEKLRAMALWAMQVQVAGEMPSLPSQNSTLRAALVANRAYLDRLMQVSDRLGEWIVAAQSEGTINRDLAPEVVLYTVYARACDPVLGLLKATGQYSDDQIIEMLLTTCFHGLSPTR
jgi:AcrR family transcriptional regulator